MSVFAAFNVAKPLNLGAPGVYAIDAKRSRALGQVRMDIPAFVGVSSRGPCRGLMIEDSESVSMASIASNWEHRHRTLPVKVSSWDEFTRIFGAFESPGRLPYALANFFEQGGQQAYVCRIVHEYSDASENLNGLASASLDIVLSEGAGLIFQADNEGAWGNALSIAAGYSFLPIEFVKDTSTASTIVVEQLQELQTHCLLRCINDDPDNPSDNFSQYRFITHIEAKNEVLAADSLWSLTLDSALPGKVTRITRVRLDINVFDKQSGRLERHRDIEFAAEHQRFIGRILLFESNLVKPQKEWLTKDAMPLAIEPLDLDLHRFDIDFQFATAAVDFSGGVDRYKDLEHEDFFDASWVLGNDELGSGIHSLVLTDDCAMLVVPDLYVPEPFEKINESQIEELLSGAEFTRCFDSAPTYIDAVQTLPTLPQLVLDPRNESDLRFIIQLQQRIAYFTDQMKSTIALFDVPPSLSESDIVRWRSHFNHAYCACYHPWLKVDSYGEDGQLLNDPKIINPSAVAAGIIASTEIEKGIAHGPANQIAQSVYALQTQVSESFQGEVHHKGVNVFMQQSDGIWLTAARTMNVQVRWRQLSVVRLMTMLKKVLYQQMQWLVFEPNSPSLWSDVEFTLDTFLRQLFTAGMFAGESPDQAYFVQCDETTNPPSIIDNGQLVSLIGVAPAHPLEFIVLRISRDADGTLGIVSD